MRLMRSWTSACPQDCFRETIKAQAVDNQRVTTSDTVEGKVMRWGVVFLLFVISNTPVVGQDTGFLGVGEIQRSCGELIQASDAERKERPPGARATQTYNREFHTFIAVADGFLTGANYTDPTRRMVGSGTEQPGRIAWLEAWCRAHPLDQYVVALIELRKELIRRLAP